MVSPDSCHRRIGHKGEGTGIASIECACKVSYCVGRGTVLANVDE